VAGGGVGLFGLAGLLRDAAKTRPLVWALWLGGLVLVHDLVLAPGVHLVGAWLRRHSGDAARWPLQLGLVVSGVLALASVPVLYGVGRATQPGNRSVLPGDYPRALLGVLAVVWGLVLLFAAVRQVKARVKAVDSRLHAPARGGTTPPTGGEPMDERPDNADRRPRDADGRPGNGT
jgi:hypothetical protein